MINRTKLKKIISIAIKVVIIIAAYGFIYKQVFHKEDIEEIYTFIQLFYSHSSFYIYFITLILLMFCNWGIETYKWKYLMKKLEVISFFKSYAAVLTGVTVSTFTPNRIGEYFGRIFILEKALRIEGILVTLVGSLSQLIVSIIAGIIALIFFPEYSGYDNYPIFLYWGLVCLSISIIAIILLIYFNISLIHPMIGKMKFSYKKKMIKYLRIFSIYTSKELMFSLFLSTLRFLIFSFQLFLLFQIFNINLPIIEGLFIIFILFFIITIIPSIALLELGIRGSVAIFLINIFLNKNHIDIEYAELSVLTATTLLWMINLLIPALLGTLFIFKLKFFRKNPR